MLSEWHYILHTKDMLRIILGILLIPTFYAVIFLASLWDPYGNLNHLPVGIVDQDVNTTYQGHHYQLGKELTHKLVRSNTTNFRSLSSTSARHELASGQIYMIITIPRNFSTGASRFGTRSFHSITLNEQTNAGFSFIAMKMTTAMAGQLQIKLDKQLNRSYFQTLNHAMQRTGHGLTNASVAITKSTTGLTHVTGGLTATQTGLNALLSGNQQLNNALAQLTTKSTSAATALAILNRNDQQLLALTEQAVQAKPATQTQLFARMVRLIHLNTLTTQQLLVGTHQTGAAMAKLEQVNNQSTRGIQQLLTAENQSTSALQSVSTADTKIAHGLTSAGTGLINHSNTTASVQKALLNPIRLHHRDTTHVKNNGTGMAPYLMSVALFVGCITFNIIYDMYTPHQRPHSAGQWWMQKISFLLIFTAGAASLMLLLLELIDHLAPLELFKTWLFSILTIWTFASIVTFFNLILGKTGAWLMLLFMIIQLGGSAGTYPIELSNQFFKVIHPYLPMSISIDAFRSTLSIGQSIWPETFIFATILISFNLLILVFFTCHLRQVQHLNFSAPQTH
ncbi:YhgE/Pip domain-containing protein [Lactiplantibacillus paraplantarum]|uniref:YhgE/Pip family protein n=1 Tax=Lactiplantibacillus paraplantarum TaxID=60520 RepID=UPI0021A3D80B|nr:YhgE/Pip domain-containing protein [Lactiplantibacillus paraplantarum]MCT4457714.1 YhgE/Pip domain-containing protein [Lactiplantibacillus paraplantarum]